MENLSYDDKDYNLWLLMLKVKRLMLKARERDLQQYGITPEQAGMLYLIQANEEKVTPADISRLTFREPHTVSGLINRMEKAGLVTKHKDLDRKNMIRIALTDKGRHAYEQSTIREPIHLILSALSEDEREKLRSYLNRIQGKTVDVLRKYHDLPFITKVSNK